MHHTDFVHLHLHTYYSLLDGACPINLLAKRVHELKMPAVAMTDHGNMFGAIEFYETMSKIGVKPILGVEAYLITEGSRHKKEYESGSFLSHITLLAKNIEGYRNLCKLVTAGHLEGFYYHPRIDKEILEQNSAGLIALSGGLSGEVPQRLKQGDLSGARKAAEYYAQVFGERNFYLELNDHGLKEQGPVKEGLLEFSKELGLPVVATNDVYYLSADQSLAHDALVCIRTGTTLGAEKRMRNDSDQFYLKSAEEMKTLFRDHPEAIANTIDIAERCNVELDFNTYSFPKFNPPEGKDLLTHLKEESAAGLEKRLKQISAREKQTTVDSPVYYQRLEEELQMIRKTGFSGYFLIVADFIRYAKSKGIPVGPGRGSAAGSLVAYCLDITDIDPIEHQLLFERFLNPERVSQPDMDIDFCMRRREEVIEYVGQKYGSVSQIITFGKMKARAVVRDVGRVLGIPYGEVDRIAKMIPMTLNITLEEALEMEPELKKLTRADENVGRLIEIARMIEGFPRHASTHAAGIVISDEPLVNFLPLYKGQHDEIVTQFDMKGVEKIGLIKFDFLGLKTLTVVHDTIALAKERHGVTIDMQTLPLDDPKTFESLTRGETAAIFQLESSGMTDLVIKLKPNRFEDLTALVALFRPGPLGSGMVDDFINRKHGRTPIEYELPQLQPILEDTYGVILYQEQVMKIASALANFTLGDADLLRRAMGKKIASEMAQQREKFLVGAKGNKIPDKTAAKIFDLMAKFAEYGFNKCVVGETELVDAETGELVTVDRLVQEGPGRRIFSCDDRFKIVSRKIDAVMSNGRKKVFSLDTHLGYRILATANHPFLTLQGWKKLGELKVGDRIATPRCLPVCTQKEWPEHEVISLAWLLSEGNTCHPSSLYFYNNDIVLIEDFSLHIEKFAFTKARRYQRQNRCWEVCVNTGVRLQADVAEKRGHPRRSGAFVWAQKLGLLGKKAHEKHIPPEVFLLSQKQLALFLGRLWSGDGFVFGVGNVIPFYASSSKKLAMQVQHLLLRFGIVSRIAEKNFPYKGVFKKGFAVFLTGDNSIYQFLDWMGPYLLGREVQIEALKQYLRKSGVGKSSRDTIPSEVKFWVREEKADLGKTWIEIEEETDLSMKEFCGGLHPGKKGFRRETVERLGKYFHSERLSAVAASDIYWDEVTAINSHGIRETYDLTVEKNHNFVANGIFVHNSHSAAYAMISYHTAYLKIHYPVEYMTSVLTVEAGNTDKLIFYLSECQSIGIKVLPPDVNESDFQFRVVDDKTIRFGLSGVKGIGEAAIEQMALSRGEAGPFTSIFDFCERVDARKANRRVLEALVKCGAFDFTEARRAQLLAVAGKALEMGGRLQKDSASGQFSLLDQFKAAASSQESADKLPDIPEWPERQRLQFEKEALGFYLSGHPMSQYENLITQYATTDCAAVQELPDKREVRVGGVVAVMREINTKKGDRMAFVTLEDLKGSVEVVVFPELYAKTYHWIKSERPILVIGAVDEQDDACKILAEDILLLEQVPQHLTKSIHIKLKQHEASPQQLEALKNILSRFQGPCTAYLHLVVPDESETVMKLPDTLKVNPSQQLVAMVQHLFGHNVTWFQGS